MGNTGLRLHELTLLALFLRMPHILDQRQNRKVGVGLRMLHHRRPGRLLVLRQYPVDAELQLGRLLLDFLRCHVVAHRLFIRRPCGGDVLRGVRKESVRVRSAKPRPFGRVGGASDVIGPLGRRATSVRLCETPDRVRKMVKISGDKFLWRICPAPFWIRWVVCLGRFMGVGNSFRVEN